ncbi:MAG TPA: extracellular solute-binding protein [Candidatus Limnocylindrales bacterium]|nr:extracellular solute-binding protein [Candidatus Limnocylindrales bacterium]
MKLLRFAPFVMALALVAGACGPGAATTSPSVSAAAPSSGGSSASAAAPSGSAAAISGTLTIWHSYDSSGGNAEFTAFSKIVDNLKAANPGLQVNLLAVPFGDLFKKYETEQASGGGPDMIIAPNDSLGVEARGGFIADIGDKIGDVLGASNDVSKSGSTVDGKIYEVPESLKAVAMYYDTAKVPNPPKTTQELLDFVKGGGKAGIIAGEYFGWGFYSAFGGKVFDDTGKCAASAGGVADAIQYVKDLKAAGALVDFDYNKVNDAFKNKTIDVMLNGNWVLGDYKTARPTLGVAPVPAGPAGPAKTMTGVDGWYINSASPNAEVALAAAKFLVSAESQKVYVDTAGHVPANTSVAISDPLVKAFSDAIAAGDPRPQTPEMANYWGAFNNAWKEVLDKGTDAKAAVATACKTMDTANKK